jgi:hypothetical protein
MTTATQQLFDRYKCMQGLSADNAAALALGIKRQTVSNWRRRGTQAEPRLIQAMCDALEEDAAPWLIRVQHEQAHHADDKQVWRRMALQLGYRLSSVMALVSLFCDDTSARLAGLA